jgi:hypothetical protein
VEGLKSVLSSRFSVLSAEQTVRYGALRRFF